MSETEYDVGVYTTQRVTVMAESEREARQKAREKANRDDMEMFTETPQKVNEDGGAVRDGDQDG